MRYKRPACGRTHFTNLSARTTPDLRGKKKKRKGEQVKKSEVLIRSDSLSSRGNHLSSNMKYSFLGLFSLLGFICAQVKKNKKTSTDSQKDRKGEYTSSVKRKNFNQLSVITASSFKNSFHITDKCKTVARIRHIVICLIRATDLSVKCLQHPAWADVCAVPCHIMNLFLLLVTQNSSSTSGTTVMTSNSTSSVTLPPSNINTTSTTNTTTNATSTANTTNSNNSAETQPPSTMTPTTNTTNTTNAAGTQTPITNTTTTTMSGTTPTVATTPLTTRSAMTTMTTWSGQSHVSTSVSLLLGSFVLHALWHWAPPWGWRERIVSYDQIKPIWPSEQLHLEWWEWFINSDRRDSVRLCEGKSRIWFSTWFRAFEDLKRWLLPVVKLIFTLCKYTTDLFIEWIMTICVISYIIVL